MQKIGTPDGLFYNGDPTIGKHGTTVSAQWLNAVQSELVALVEQQGGQLDATAPDQVAKLLFKTQPKGDSSTKLATTAFVQSALFSTQKMRVFTENGTFTVPENVTTIYVSGCAGGGGGGGGLGYMDNWFSNGGGGGAAQSVIKKPISVQPGQVLLVTIGAGGRGGAGGTPGNTGADGTAGGNTSLGSLLALNSGGGGWSGKKLGQGNYGASGHGYPPGGPGCAGSVMGHWVTGVGGSTPFGGGALGHLSMFGGYQGNTGFDGGGYGSGGSGGGGVGGAGCSGGAGGNGTPGLLIIEW